MDIPILQLFFLVLCCSAIVQSQSDGKYRPPSTTTAPRKSDGRYNPKNDGRYRPANDGRYVHKDDGKYVHKDVGYIGGGGEYTGGGGDYAGGGGQYTGDFRKYIGSGYKYSGGSNSGGSASGGGGNGLSSISGGSNQGAAGGSSSSGAAIETTSAKPTTVRTTTETPTVPTKLGSGTGVGGGGWKIVKEENVPDPNGYHYVFETENGILAEEKGRIEKLKTDDGLRSKGFYEYTGDDGALYRVDYVADDRGFVPVGDHIPTVPPAIVKMLKYLEEHGPKN